MLTTANIKKLLRSTFTKVHNYRTRQMILERIDITLLALEINFYVRNNLL